MTYTARHVSRTATDPNLLFDRSYRLLRQPLTLVKFHKQHHAFVFLIFCHLTNYEAVRYPLNLVTTRSGSWFGKARVQDIVYLGGPKPNATRVPKLSEDEGSTVSIPIRRKETIASNKKFEDRRDPRIGNLQYPITPAKHHKTSPIAHP